MSWFTTSDYFIMDAVARARAEELHERSERESACARDDDDPKHDALARSAERARPAPVPCHLARSAA